MGLFDMIFGSYSDKEIKKIQPLVDKVLALEPKFAKFSDTELKNNTEEFKKRHRNGESLDDLLPTLRPRNS